MSAGPEAPKYQIEDELTPCVHCGRERPYREFKLDAYGFAHCEECWPEDLVDQKPLLSMRFEEPDVVEILGRRYHLEFFRQLEDVTPEGRALRVIKNARGQTSIERFDLSETRLD